MNDQFEAADHLHWSASRLGRSAGSDGDRSGAMWSSP